MKVSVVICEHTTDRYTDLTEAADSVLDQTHNSVELVLVSDGSPAVTNRMERDYGDHEATVVVELNENRGLLKARNAGAEAASGDVIAFLDDDAVAADDWVARLVDAYEARDVPAAGGRIKPRWVAGEPDFFPEEFYWLVGATHKGFAEGPGEVRNTFGSNISFRREVFLDLDGFDANVGGRKGDNKLQGGETELCARMAAEHGHGVWYDPEAEVEHKIFAFRTDPLWLLRRAFWQGYSKRGMESLLPESTGEESDFLGRLLGKFIPERVMGLIRNPNIKDATQFGTLLALTLSVGMGYVYGFVKFS